MAAILLVTQGETHWKKVDFFFIAVCRYNVALLELLWDVLLDILFHNSWHFLIVAVIMLDMSQNRYQPNTIGRRRFQRIVDHVTDWRKLLEVMLLHIICWFSFIIWSRFGSTIDFINDVFRRLNSFLCFRHCSFICTKRDKNFVTWTKSFTLYKWLRLFSSTFHTHMPCVAACACSHTNRENDHSRRIQFTSNVNDRIECIRHSLFKSMILLSSYALSGGDRSKNKTLQKKCKKRKS